MKKIAIINEKNNDLIDSVKIKKKRKTAVYARVSTDKDEQFSSYEAQIDYYTNLINNSDNLELIKVYTDEGISGTNTKFRKGFNEMIKDALDGKIDLIITKSISRFARNTVDSLVYIRKLKEIGCEIYFEKENIYTFDSKGELLITIMSSIAQEESRSISDNVKWGIRKQFSDGKYYIHYSEFLGYEKGKNGEPVINELEAITVKRIYLMFLEGMSFYQIAKELTREHILTPMKKETWHSSVIKSILTNEKYIGDAILQKTICTDFLTKKRKVNNGEINKYYVKNGHKAIISKTLFNNVQKKMKNITKSRFYENDKEYSKRIKCGCCGNWFYEQIINKGTNKETIIWKCNKKNSSYICKSKKYTKDYIKHLFDLAKDKLKNNPEILLSALMKLKVSQLTSNSILLEINEINKYISISKNEILVNRIGVLNKKIRQYSVINKLLINTYDLNDLLKIIKNNNIINDLIDFLIINNDDTVIFVTINGNYIKLF